MIYRCDLIRQAAEKESRARLAARSGVSFDTVDRAIAGENLSVRTLNAIASAIGLPMVELFKLETSPSDTDAEIAA